MARRRRREYKYKTSTDPNKEQVIVIEGVITQVLPNTQFKVYLEEADMEIHCVISGKMRRYWIRMMEGDKVKVELSPYDMERGRIVWKEGGR